MAMNHKFSQLFNDGDTAKIISDNFVSLLPSSLIATQSQTANAFSDKWKEYDYSSSDFVKFSEHQKQWYLNLYGFGDEATLAAYLQKCSMVLDAGAGMCYKAAWFAELSPSTIVVAADISNALYQAAEHYKNLDNLLFVQCDIGCMNFFKDGLFDYISCDQVIHHTADPFKTFQELVRLTALSRELSVYVYRKKALPRELVDDYFREFSKSLSHERLMELSTQLTELGRLLNTVDRELDFPDIPVLGIEGGKMSVQRFIYWNLLKCYWNDELGYQNSVMTNYDWYSPSQAYRYSEQEFKGWIEKEHLEIIYFHKDRPCYSGRFRKLMKA